MDNHIEHLLKVASKGLISMIDNFKPEFTKWIQYSGIDIKNDYVYFNFRHSNSSLTFSVRSSHKMHTDRDWFLELNSEIYDFFRNVKYDHLDRL